MEGPEKEVLQASGLKEISETNVDGTLTVQDGISGDALASCLADGLATQLGLQLRNPFLQALTFHGTKYVLLEASEYVFGGVSGFTSGGTIGFSIAQLKEMVKDILNKLDTILDEPSQSCGDFIELALQAINDGYPVAAKGYFEEADKNAVKGFNYAKGECKPELMMNITRLKMLAEMALATFDDENKNFVIGLEKLKDSQKQRLYSIIRDDSDIIVSKNFFFFPFMEDKSN